ncbi:MAG: MCE family protein [Deltaproteobacteria bacterium]|nr:MCE family protein [Deltaproteobacteria bacterium]
MKFTAAAKVGLTAIVLALVFIGIYSGMDWKIPFLSDMGFTGYTINVKFTSVKGLDPGADVQLNGALVGEVWKIKPDGYGEVLVEIRIKKRGDQIHENADFTISRDSIFGGYTIDIVEPRSSHINKAPVNGECVVEVDAGLVGVGGFLLKNDVEIGRIYSIEPSNDPLIETVLIRLSPDVELDTTMAFVPMLSTIGAPGGLVVYEVLPDGARVEGIREPGPEDLVATADAALRDITEQAGLIINQVSLLLEDLTELIDAEQISNILDELGSNATSIARNIDDLTGQLNILLAETRPHITSTLENVDTMSSDASDLVAGLQDFNTPEFRENIITLVENLTESTETLNDILVDLEKYTSDDELRLDVRSTIAEAHSTLRTAQDSLDTANRIMGDVADSMDVADRIETGGEFTLRYADDSEEYTGDFNFWLGMEESDMFVTAGVDDIGESERANAQVGFRLSEELATRIGVHRGKLGLCFNWRSEAMCFITDLYDPNDLTWDVYGGYAILPELEIIVGVEDVLEEEELNFGLAYKF